jgi:hypothetical protein
MTRRAIGLAVLALIACTGCATAVTEQASNVAGTAADLEGTVISSTGGPVEYWAEYGRTRAYGRSSERRTSNIGVNDPLRVGLRVEGLARGTTYHFRVCARDSQQQNGPGCGKDRTFRTVNVDCGDVITRDVVLSATLTCPWPEGLYRPGLVVGADGIELDLNGHELRGPLYGLSLHPEGEPGILNHDRDQFHLHGGTVAGWGVGVQIDEARFARIYDLETASWGGLVIGRGDHTSIRRFEALSVGRGGFALSVASDDLLLADSSGQVMSAFGDRMRVLRNRVGGIFESEVCLSVGGSSSLVADNVAGGCPNGGLVLSSGSDTALVRNRMTGSVPGPYGPDDQPDGIRVEAAATGATLRDNVAAANEDDGIDVRGAGARLQGNRADDNGDFGIDAPPGATDLGGNRASGNGNPLQCRNVFCQ